MIVVTSSLSRSRVRRAREYVLASDADRVSLDGDPLLPHHRPRARSVIFLYMDGGPSQVDTFDPKPVWLLSMAAPSG